MLGKNFAPLRLCEKQKTLRFSVFARNKKNMNPNKPYNELPFLPPSKEVWEQIEVYKVLAEARAALAELKGRCPVIPNPYMLINTLVLQEAKDSSSIENIFTTSEKLYRAFASSMVTADPQTKEVLRYRQALLTAWENLKAKDFSVSIMENIYHEIKEKDDGVRDNEVFIGNAFETIYTPPCCKKVILEKLNNWIDFAKTDTAIDPLIKMAILHYQFEVQNEASEVYSYELVSLLFEQPYCKIAFLVDKGIASRNTASKYLGALEKIGILKKEQSGSESLYVNQKLYQLLKQ
jgi:Fic family protein